MSREIDTITNVVSCAVLDSNAQWTYNGSYMPCPDEIIVRQISYWSNDPAPQLLLIKSNLGILGSIVTATFSSNPGTRIQTRDPISGQLTFQLFVPTANSLFPAVVVPGDMIAIHMDFIKYRR